MKKSDLNLSEDVKCGDLSHLCEFVSKSDLTTYICIIYFDKNFSTK
jgi:hypothetical protein